MIPIKDCRLMCTLDLWSRSEATCLEGEVKSKANQLPQLAWLQNRINNMMPDSFSFNDNAVEHVISNIQFLKLRLTINILYQMFILQVRIWTFWPFHVTVLMKTPTVSLAVGKGRKITLRISTRSECGARITKWLLKSTLSLIDSTLKRKWLKKSGVWIQSDGR